eukprot:TRINITY_DN2347_c0_g1_i1.p1 TRINITY_DN2347_c0_g1~~TRINITY_DN2347_c0_g1_i1.p1  ORF type:complete len:613 (-),score=184.87 TRINITY_DN2347_c0_g1_i1:365-2203(-)
MKKLAHHGSFQQDQEGYMDVVPSGRTSMELVVSSENSDVGISNGNGSAQRRPSFGSTLSGKAAEGVVSELAGKVASYGINGVSSSLPSRWNFVEGAVKEMTSQVGQLATPFGIANIALGAGSAAVGAYNAYHVHKLQDDVTGTRKDLSAVGAAIGRVKHGMGDMRGDLMGLGFGIKSAKRDVQGLRQEVIRACDQLFGSLEELAEQLQDSVAFAAKEMVKEVHRGIASVHKKLEEKDLDKLKLSCKKVHRRYKSCLLPLTKGEVPHSTDIERLMDTAESLAAKVEIATEKIPMGDPRRLPLLAFRTFAARAEVDARKMRQLLEEEGAVAGDAEKLDAYSAEILNNVLGAIAAEVDAMWADCNGTLYAIGVELAPVLAQYALLGRALDMALSEKTVTVLDGERAIIAQGDEDILFDDGLDELRSLFPPEVSKIETAEWMTMREAEDADMDALEEALRLHRISDFVWYAAWREDENDLEVEEIPREVPVRVLMAELGAPENLAEGLTRGMRSALLKAVLPNFQSQAQHKILEELKWATAKGAKLMLKRPVMSVPVRRVATGEPIIEEVEEEGEEGVEERELDPDEVFEDAEEWFECVDTIDITEFSVGSVSSRW